MFYDNNSPRTMMLMEAVLSGRDALELTRKMVELAQMLAEEAVVSTVETGSGGSEEGVE